MLLRNAIKAIGYEIKDITKPEEIESAQMIIFPGVGSFGQAILVCDLSPNLSIIRLLTHSFEISRVFVRKVGLNHCSDISSQIVHSLVSALECSPCLKVATKVPRM